VVEKIVGEELLEDLEITPALHFLGVAAHDRLRGLTQIVSRHDFVLCLFAACEQVGELEGPAFLGAVDWFMGVAPV